MEPEIEARPILGFAFRIGLGPGPGEPIHLGGRPNLNEESAMNTHRHDRRALPASEALDERLVLSAASAAVAALHHDIRLEQRLEARLAGMESRHGSHATRAESHLVARIARLDARIALLEASTSPPVPSPGPLPGNVASALQSLYQEYEAEGSGSSFTPSLPSDKLLQISGTSVAVDLKMPPAGDFNSFVAMLQSDGVQVTSSSAAYGLVEGMLPIVELPAVAQVAASVTPTPPPVLYM
jgi:hypothetical protein